MNQEEQIEEPAAETSGTLDKVVRIGQLMDLYGALLTERQRLFVQLHYDEDLSFGEIARNHGVSRQAIHDAVKHAERALVNYEEKLGMLAKGMTPARGPATASTGRGSGEEPTQGTGSETADPVTMPELSEYAAHLRRIHERLRGSGGIIYNAEGITKEIGEIAQAIGRMAGEVPLPPPES
ncbi:YlxM family DNA-binding protein [Candidatus Poribacteria bacterium]|nr:YlxM family DNA-binding protein [Candidatus Poribacteria bacterium]